MFVDECRITVSGGGGGNGCLSFRREKFVPKGGPDGGDGGDGGSVFLVADSEVTTLLAFRYRTLFAAERGRHGQGANKSGRSGRDLEIAVPVGTVVLSEDAHRRLADLSRPGDRFVAARGGRGGRGNARFATSTHQAPVRHEPGEAGESRSLRLELKLLADVGLIGCPNAGKSTLLSRISAARPKIAEYPFTTLEPHLGVVRIGDDRSLVVADIPGLIEGAHVGAGLGLRFLRHVERCALLLHLVDPTTAGRDPLDDFEAILSELREYGEDLSSKPQIVVLTKADAVQDSDGPDRIRTRARSLGYRCVSISAVTGDGLSELLRVTAATIAETRRRGPTAEDPVA